MGVLCLFHKRRKLLSDIQMYFVAIITVSDVRIQRRSSSFSFSPRDTMSSGNNCQPQTFTKPTLGEKEAMELVDRVFGLKVSWIRPLPSYDDQNFHVRVSRNKGAAEGADEYVLKITNSEDSQEPDLIEAQTQAMMFLSAEGFPSATPCLTRDGNIMSLESGGEQLRAPLLPCNHPQLAIWHAIYTLKSNSRLIFNC